MINSADPEERKVAVEKINLTFSTLENKGQAWKNLLALTKDEDSDVRYYAADALGSAFPHFTDKDQGTKDLLALTKDEDSDVRWGAAGALGSAFAHLTDKDQATKNLLALTKDQERNVRMLAAYALSSAFQYLPDQVQASQDLLALTKDHDRLVRRGAAEALGHTFRYLPDRVHASKDLLALLKDQQGIVRWMAAFALGSAFQYLPDKEQAWNDLLALTLDQDSVDLHLRMSEVLGPVFQYLPDKEQASKDLLALTKDHNSVVRGDAAYTLGSVFQYLADPEQASIDLLALTKDEDREVRVSAHHSLGKISIYRATNADDTDVLQNELENAIGFFEKSALEAEYFNPAKFCLPFYRSYYSVIFRKQEAEEEVKKNLDEAKRAVSGSESREKLLEAVESLSNALSEAQKLRDLNDIKADLNGFRRYCDRACELLDTTEETAPGATKLLRRGLPVIDERIQGIITEIQEKAKAVCRQSLNTPLEDFGREINQISQDLPKVRDPITLEKQINIMLTALSPVCEKISEIDNEACRYYQMAQQEQYVEDKIPLINMILSKMPLYMEYSEKINILEEKIDKILFSLEPEITEKLEITVGAEYLGTGAKHVITIPIQVISYPELKADLERIKEMTSFKLASIPLRLAQKIKDYFVQNEMDYLLEKLR
jgi:HEAT repeat protein